MTGLSDKTPAETRLALWRNGYSPIPVNGKIPPLTGWEKRTETNPDEIEIWDKIYGYAKNKGTPAIDIDVSHQPAAEALEDLARNLFSDEGTFLVRIGRAPRRAIPFRAIAPFKKIRREYVDPNGEVHKVEILGDGQQVVVGHAPGYAEALRLDARVAS